MSDNHTKVRASEQLGNLIYCLDLIYSTVRKTNLPTKYWVRQSICRLRELKKKHVGLTLRRATIFDRQLAHFPVVERSLNGVLQAAVATVLETWQQIKYAATGIPSGRRRIWTKLRSMAYNPCVDHHGLCHATSQIDLMKTATYQFHLVESAFYDLIHQKEMEISSYITTYKAMTPLYNECLEYGISAYKALNLPPPIAIHQSIAFARRVLRLEFLCRLDDPEGFAGGLEHALESPWLHKEATTLSTSQFAQAYGSAAQDKVNLTEQEQFQVPRPPKLRDGLGTCPFCRMDVDTEDIRNWRDHVLQNLRSHHSNSEMSPNLHYEQTENVLGAAHLETHPVSDQRNCQYCFDDLSQLSRDALSRHIQVHLDFCAFLAPV